MGEERFLLLIDNVNGMVEDCGMNESEIQIGRVSNYCTYLGTGSI